MYNHGNFYITTIIITVNYINYFDKYFIVKLVHAF